MGGERNGGIDDEGDGGMVGLMMNDGDGGVAFS